MEPMAEHMKGFCLFFEGAKIPNHILKRITRQLLSALDYAHSMEFIHTGTYAVSSNAWVMLTTIFCRYKARQYHGQNQRLHYH